MRLSVEDPIPVDRLILRRSYYYDFGVRIVHMMFLSWGGDMLFFDDGTSRE